MAFPTWDPARSLQPHEWSKMTALGLDEYRCPTLGCRGPADVTTYRPGPETLACVYGHIGHLGATINSVMRRAQARRTR